MKDLKSSSSARQVAFAGIASAAAIVLGYIEFLIPFNFGIPGIKLGLSNLIILLVLMTSSLRTTVFVTAIKISVTSLLFGSVLTFCYSLAGGVLSLAVMALLKKSGKFGVVGISAAGGVTHNIGQLLAALLLTAVPKIALYLPVLVLSGAITGALIGITLSAVLTRLDKRR